MHKLNTLSIIAFIIAIFIFIAIPIILPITYSSVDDYFYLWILSGRYTGECTPMAPFIGYLYSSLICWFYRFTDSVEWYSLGFYAQMFICYVISLYILLHSNLGKYTKTILYVTLIVLQAYFEIRPHNGNVSIECSMTSLFLLYYCKSKKATALSLIIFLFATQMRWEASFIPFMVCFPMFYYGFKIKDFRHYIKPTIKLSSILAIGIITLLINNVAYSSKEWKEFKTYNNLRGYIVDNPQNERVYSLIKDQQSKDDYDLLRICRIGDNNFMDVEAVQKYVDYLKSEGLSTSISLTHWYYGEYKRIGVWWIVILFVICTGILIHRKDWNGIIVLIAVLIMFALGNYYLMSQTRPKERLLFPFLFSLFFVFSCLIYKNNKKLFSWPNILVCAPLIVNYCLLSVEAYKTNLANVSRQATIDKILESIPDAKILPYCISPFPEIFSARESTYGSKVYNNDWLMCTPLGPNGQKGLQPIANGCPILCPKNRFTDVNDVMRVAIVRHYGKQLKIYVSNEYNNLILIRLAD